MWLLIILIILSVILLLFSFSRKKKQPEVTNQAQKDSDTQKAATISSSEKKDITPTPKTSVKTEKNNQRPKTKDNTSVNRKQTQNRQQEISIIEKALTYYGSYELKDKRKVQAETIIQLTSNEKIRWTEGMNDEGSIDVWAADYQEGLLALYKDLERKKYQLVFYEDGKGYIQPYTEIVKLHQAITSQIKNRGKRIEQVPITSFLVRTNTFRCTKNHGTEDIIAVFTVLNKNGNIITVEAPGGYCKKCRVFYIHDYTYQKLLTYGQPLCTVISEKQYVNGAYLKMNTGMAQQSLLRMCGYTVSASEGLSDSERRRILDTIISNGIMSKFDIITYLNYFVTIRKNDTKDMSEAIRKWNSDIRYLEGLNTSSLKRYSVNRIYKIDR